MRPGRECLDNGQYPIRLFPSIVLNHSTLNIYHRSEVTLTAWPRLWGLRCLIIVVRLVTIPQIVLLNYNNIDPTFLSQPVLAVTDSSDRRSLGKHNPLSQSLSTVPSPSCPGNFIQNIFSCFCHKYFIRKCWPRYCKLNFSADFYGFPPSFLPLTGDSRTAREERSLAGSVECGVWGCNLEINTEPQPQPKVRSGQYFCSLFLVSITGRAV